MMGIFLISPKKQLNFKAWFFTICIGVISAILMFIFLGIPTDVINTALFNRMVRATKLDLLILTLTSVLFGIYVSSVHYMGKVKKINKAPARSGFIGGFMSIFAIACPVCIKLFVWIFGAVFLMKYYDPMRPLIGIFSIGLLSFAIYSNVKIINNCESCEDCEK